MGSWQTIKFEKNIFRTIGDSQHVFTHVHCYTSWSWCSLPVSFLYLIWAQCGINDLLHLFADLNYNVHTSTALDSSLVRLRSLEWPKVGRPSWLAQPGSVAPTRLWVRILAGTNFRSWVKKNLLAVLVARLGPLGHGPGFEGFFAAGRSRSRFLLMKNGGVRSPPATFFYP